MKKAVNILCIMLLSVFLVWTGTGVVLARCEHTGLLSAPKPIYNNDECLTEKHHGCMEVLVKKLAPSKQAQFKSIDLEPIQLALLSVFVTLTALLPLSFHAKANAKEAVCQWYSPPRAYLRSLTTLLI